MALIVALDLETTGLDPAQDAVIEIGAVKFNDKRVEAEFSTLINPRKPISAFITNLTGITNSMVLNAPLLINALPELADFIGDAPILGQNIGFDLAFLQKAGILRSNPTLDTYELASVLMPSAARYSLGALTSQLGVLLPATHRALDDARATHAVYLELMNQLERLPIELVAEILRLSEGLAWNGELPFRWTLQKLTRQGIKPKKGGSETGALFATAKGFRRTLCTGCRADAAQFRKPGSRANPVASLTAKPRGFEHRSLRSDAAGSRDAFSQQKHSDGGGWHSTGKSLAYLIPAAAWALRNGERVVISTNTIALQDQLVNKDIPDMVAALDLDINVSVLKGRNNYLCPRRLNLLRRRQPETVDELRVLAKVLVWLQSSDSGDRNEINLNGPVERSVWSRLSAEDEGCKLETCLKRTGGRCPYYRARIAADSAHILIVNHALLLADAAANGRVLPEYHYLIVDEAHHLESATTDAMSFRLRAPDVTRLVRELGSAEQGLFGRLLALAQTELKPSELAALTNAVEQATDQAFRLDNAITAYFRALDNAMTEMQEGKPASQYAQQERITESKRKAQFWFDVEITWESAQICLHDLLNAIKTIREGVRGLADSEDEEVEDLLGILGTMSLNFLEIDAQLEGLTMKPDPNTIYWVEQDPLQHRLTLQAAPLEIGKLMEKTLWYSKESVILTSATLTTHGEFDYLRRRLNAEDAEELTVGSPFDYENSALVYLARDIPEPKEAYPFQKAAEEALVRLAKATGGRMLALFTSYAQLQKTSRAIEGPLAKADITVYEQGEGASASALLDVFKETPRAVLLGTRAFWEGVDVPGEALSVLVITKLPFDVPSDPIVEARSESFDDPFNEYMLPEAILRFRQGFGRLIRTQTDRGVVAILDKRILSKQYGRLFMESLPGCTVVEGFLANLPEKAASWLGT